MTTNQQDEAARQSAERMQQEQAERDFIAAREQLAAEDMAPRMTEEEAAGKAIEAYLNAKPDEKEAARVAMLDKLATMNEWKVESLLEDTDPPYEDEQRLDVSFADIRAHRAGMERDAVQQAEEARGADPEQAAQIAELVQPIRAELDSLITDCEPSELGEIARNAAVQNIEQRTASGERVTLEALQGEAYSDEIRAGLALPIPENADLYLVHRVHEAAREELDGMTNRDADPFDREELEAVAAMKAREIEAAGRLHEMTHDAATPDHNPNGPGNGQPEQQEAGQRLNASPLAGIGRQQEPDGHSQQMEEGPGSSQQMEDGADIPDGRFHLVERTNADGSTALYQEPFETFEAAQGAAEHRAETAQPGEAFNAVSLNLGEMIGRDYVTEKTPEAEQQPEAGPEWFPDADAERAYEENGIRTAEEYGIAEAERELAAGQEQQPEAMTLEAIERNPWNAVNLPIPDNADCELLGVIEGTAATLADAKLAELSQLEEAHQMGAPVAPGAWDAAQDAHIAASTRAMEAEDCLEELACLTQGDGERGPDAAQIGAADSFRMGADAATNTEQGQKDRDLAARILALENLTGNEASKDHYAFIAGQRSFSDQIAEADTPERGQTLQGCKFAHAQNYAADLCERGQIQHGDAGRFEEAAMLGLEGRIHREIAERFSPGGPENNPPERGDEIGKDTGSIADSMTAAAAEALGHKTRVEFIVDGPSSEQQQGERPEPQEMTSGPTAQGRYAALRGAGQEQEQDPFFGNSQRPGHADHAAKQEMEMVPAPDGTYTRTTFSKNSLGSPSEAETVDVNGKAQTAFVALSATQAAAEATTQGEQQDAGVEIAVRKVAEEATKTAAADPTTRAASREIPVYRTDDEREAAAMARAEARAEAMSESEHGAGHAMGGGGRGR